MQHMPFMDVLQSQHRLGEPAEDLPFRDVLPLPPCIIDLLGQISTFTIVHQEAKPSRIAETFAVADNVRMLQRAQELSLGQGLALFLGGRFADVHHLTHHLESLLVLDQNSFAEGTFTYFL